MLLLSTALLCSAAGTHVVPTALRCVSAFSLRSLLNQIQGFMALLAQRSAEPGHGSGAGILAARDCWILRRMRRSGRVACCSNSTNEVNDGPLQEPQYYSYTDPNMGEPSPTFGARSPLADMAIWGEDMLHIKRTAQASTPAPSSSTSEQHQVMVAAMAKCSQIKLIGYKQRRSTGRKLVPWPTTKTGSRHDRMTPPRKLYSSIMN